ncbi:MAG: DUF4292 domain-containing protein [Bacteroidaceae bacterium]|nr:DUF4292 domain-containing protein [Bacteroidaceae bacterium]
MKIVIRLSVLMLCILLASCRSKKEVVSTTTTVSDNTTIGVPPSQGNKQPADAKQQEETCVTAKVRLELASNGKSTSVGGMLRMKRNDVIQLSLVTFGVLEVARIEMTPEYFLLVDKMGRQYVKASYNDVPFLRDADVDFYTIQSYFWNEQTTNYSGWEQSNFVTIGGRSLPTKHLITIPARNKTIKANLSLSNLNTDSNWEKRTQISSRYSKVSVDELWTRIMNLTL